MNRTSRRFNPSAISQYVVPVLIGFLTLALLLTLVIIFLAVAGTTPG